MASPTTSSPSDILIIEFLETIARVESAIVFYVFIIARVCIALLFLQAGIDFWKDVLRPRHHSAYKRSREQKISARKVFDSNIVCPNEDEDEDDSNEEGKGSTMATSFFVEDVCAIRGKPNTVGIVERSVIDVNTHVPNPQHEYQTMIHRDSGVKKKDFHKFIKDGIPPKDTVLVHWWYGREILYEILPIKKLQLLDRSFLVGDVVKRSTLDPVSGVVTAVKLECSLRPAKPNWEAWSRSAVANIDPETIAKQQQASEYPSVDHIPAEELRLEHQYNEDSLVLYKGWVGRIEDVVDEVYLRLSNGSIVVPEDDGELMVLQSHEEEHRVRVGDAVQTKKYNMRRGRWIFGEYDANTQPQGIVLHTRTVVLGVAWLCRRLDGGAGIESIPEPEDELGMDEFESPDFVVYDRYRGPSNAEAASQHRHFEDVVVGDGVRFRNILEASNKYGTALPMIQRNDTAGYDVNVYNVSRTSTQVRVLWQDLTVSEHQSTDLIPDANIEDENEVWPGEIVMTNERRKDSTEDWIFTPARVGVVQSVNAKDRIARVRWLQNASLLYHDQSDLDDFMGSSLLPSSTTGQRQDSDVVEDVPIYDIRPASGINRRRGDLVMLLAPDAQATSSRSGINWFGEVIDLGLDGLLTVRLGALDDVRDVQVAPELTTLAYSSDMFSEAGGPEVDSLLGSDSDSDDYQDFDSEEESDARWYVQEDTNGEQRLIEVDTEEDEEWDTEGEGDDDSSDGSNDAAPEDDEMDDVVADEEMLDLERNVTNPAQPAPETIASAIHQASLGQTNPSRPDQAPLIPDSLPNKPPNFDVLDTTVPANHGFAGTPQNTNTTSKFHSRIAKEHRILQSSLPPGVFVRTWSSRLDLCRVLIVGPLGTPYEYAPFLIDFLLPPEYPHGPPQAHFHSWTSGQGAINPNLYENGKICLSLLGTWPGSSSSESWSASNSTLLQVIVSILGLVLVKDPYFNEAGYEVKVGDETSQTPRRLYNERTYFRSRGFITHAIRKPPEGVEDVIDWLYTTGRDPSIEMSQHQQTPDLLSRAIAAAEELLDFSSREGDDGQQSPNDSLERLSKGAQIMLQRQIADMRSLSTSDLGGGAKL